MARYFKISNKHLFCQFNNIYMLFSFVKFHQRIKVKEFEVVEVE